MAGLTAILGRLTAPRAPSGGARVWLLVAAIGAVAGLLWRFAVDPQPVSAAPIFIPMLVLAAGFALAEVFVVHLRIGRSRSAYSFSLSEIPLVLGLFFATPAALVLARVLGAAVALRLHRRQSGQRLAFNLAHFALEAVVVLVVWQTLLGNAGALQPRGWAALLAAVAVADLLGTTLLAVAISSAERCSVRSAFAQVVELGPVAALVNTSCALVLVNVIVVDWRGSWAVLVIVAVLFFAHRAYLSLVRQHESLELLNDFTRHVGDDLTGEAVAAAVLRHTQRQLLAERAELCLAAPLGQARWRIDIDGEVHPLAAHGSLAEALVPEGGGLLLAPRSPKHPQTRDRLTRAGARDAMVAPVHDEDGLLGTIAVADRHGHIDTFDETDLTVLQALANHASVALRNARLADLLRHEAETNAHRALHDDLTGMPNRRFFQQQVAARLAAGAPFAVALLDLDGFRDINETLGHDVGDELLREAGARLQADLPDDTMVARLGGDEFGVLLADQDGEVALEAARRLRERLSRPLRLGEDTVTVYASVGVAVPGVAAASAPALLRDAEVAMHHAKQRRSGVELYSPEQATSTAERLALVGDLRAALHRGEVSVVYQPKLAVRSGEVEGFEALARWRHPLRGPVGPDVFIPIAEHTGLIGPLTELVLEHALRQCRLWRRAIPGATVAVNLSARSLQAPDIVALVDRQLSAAGLPAAALILEITESTVMADPENTQGVLTQLRRLGVQLAVDDLGTGHSALAYLKHLPVDEVKIDRSFVTDLPRSPDDDAIVEAIITLARRLGKRVVAEGVEDAATWQRLAALGCDMAQGYWISRPLPADETQAWVRDHAPRAGRLQPVPA